MIFGLFRRAGNDAVIDRLYRAVVDASRRRFLYADLLIPDTFEGRFETLALHAILVLRRLQACAEPGPSMAQDLVDTIFKHFDRTLREMGVGDTVVPKRMKTLAEAFGGRSAAYDAALRGEHAMLVETLTRNVFADARPGDRLADYVEAAAEGLAATELQAFVDGAIRFPDFASTGARAP